MSEPFIGEIKVVSFNFPPKGWAACNGQLLLINQNQALFSLLGTTYGGDGRVNFGLPNLQGRVPLHFNTDFTLGSRGGEEAHTLTISELAQHSHSAVGSDTPDNAGTPSGNYWGGGSFFATAPIDSPMSAAAIAPPVGGGQPHENRSPFLTLNFVIALQGIFPSQN